MPLQNKAIYRTTADSIIEIHSFIFRLQQNCSENKVLYFWLTLGLLNSTGRIFAAKVVSLVFNFQFCPNNLSKPNNDKL